MIKKWKFISRKELFEHPRMHLVEDIVELPDGKQAQYLRQAPATTHSVAVIAVNDHDQILVQHEYSYPPNQVMYQLPGGAMENGETPVEAVLRELAEESGLTAAECTQIGFVYVNNRRSDQKQFIVVARKLANHKLPQDAEEFIESTWIDRHEIASLIKTGEIQNINMLAALQLFDAHQK